MEEITEEEYKKIFKDNPKLKIISSFTDPDGTFPFGYGKPTMITDFGHNTDDILCRIHSSKEDRNCIKWNNKYYTYESKFKI